MILLILDIIAFTAATFIAASWLLHISGWAQDTRRIETFADLERVVEGEDR